MKTILYKSHISHRTLPVNLKEADSWLFKREYSRHIPNAYFRKISNVKYLNQNLYKFNGFIQYSKYTHFSKKRITNYFKDLIKFNLFSNRVIKIENAIWILDNKSHVYAHFFNDALCRLIIVSEEIRNNYEILVPDEVNKEWILEILEFLELKFKILNKNKKYKIENLYTTNYPALPGNFNKEILIKLNEMLLKKNVDSKNNKLENFNYPKRIWINREKSRRKLLNFNEIAAVLEKYEFKSIIFEDLSIVEKINLLQNIDILAGSHGSGLANMTLMKRNSTILDIRDPDDQFKNAFFSQASALDINYFYIEREKNNNTQDSINEDIIIDPQKLSNVLEQIVNYKI